MPQTIFVQMDVQVMKCLQKEATIPLPVGNLYPNSENQPKGVEIPVAAGWKSLPKWRKLVGKGRDSLPRRLKISTQKAKTGRKG